MNRIIVFDGTIRLHPLKTLQSCVHGSWKKVNFVRANRGMEKTEFDLVISHEAVFKGSIFCVLVHDTLCRVLFASLTIMEACSRRVYFQILVWKNLRCVPPVIGVPFNGQHMIGKGPSKNKIFLRGSFLKVRPVVFQFDFQIT